jgi:hypothetical protein
VAKLQGELGLVADAGRGTGPMTAATSVVVRTSAGYFLSAFGGGIAARIVGASIGPPEPIPFGFWMKVKYIESDSARVAARQQKPNCLQARARTLRTSRSAGPVSPCGHGPELTDSAERLG